MVELPSTEFAYLKVNDEGKSSILVGQWQKNEVRINAEIDKRKLLIHYE